MKTKLHESHIRGEVQKRVVLVSISGPTSITPTLSCYSINSQASTQPKQCSMAVPSKRPVSEMESPEPNTETKKTKTATDSNETQDDVETEKVTVIVGDQNFHVDKEVLTERSKYFQDMFEGTNSDEIIKLSDTESKYFAVYTEYLNMSQNGKIMGQTWDDLAALFSLGELLSDIKFHNKIVHTMVTTSEKDSIRPHDHVMRSLYNKSAPTSPIRRLMVKMTMKRYYDLEGSDYQYEDEYSVAVMKKLTAPQKERDEMYDGVIRPAKYYDTEKKRARRVAKETKASRGRSRKA
ncbi:hypothetical protein HBI18_206610 [Parastagonospora nodorum]|nr:hypothetical protein HBI18_206610 [Parastagonospora nodorum]